MSAPLTVVGGGRMGEALVAGLLAADGSAAGAITIVEPVAPRRSELQVRFGDAAAVVERLPPSEAAVIAVKPADVAAACRELAGAGPGLRRVLSIAAGVPLARLEDWLGEGRGSQPPAVLRAMPNTPALVGAGASAVAPGTAARPDDVQWALGILGAVGIVEVVDEALLDAVTGLSGSGPAYVFLLVEALIDGGVLAGLPRPVASRLAVQTVLGAGRLLAETGESPESLRGAVTSPGGTTAAGLRALEAGAVRAAVLDAVVAATERSRELGRKA